MTLAANLDLGFGRESPWIHHSRPQFRSRAARLGNRDMLLSGSVAALALHSALHFGEVRTINARSHIGRMTPETTRDRVAALKQA